MKIIYVLLLLSLFPERLLAIEFLYWGQSKTYTWLDDKDIRHFSSSIPVGVENYVTKLTEYPVFSKENGDWTYLNIYNNKNSASAAMSVKLTNTQSSSKTNSVSLWYKFDYSGSTSLIEKEMFLVTINCTKEQIKYLQSSAHFRNGKIESFNRDDTTYAVPDTSDEMLIKFACSKK